ncbi:protease complex subunit PrcB family protein [Flavobacterium psychrotrophum]|uniref:protease complex subunit PrcB family protein n=1 Tax=Flavobacterium psychrotrophum TaxID=2294119 RepID=UPI000E30F5DE|nr:protease complex subunit PrcB family protein [Flavobacterium psychrotrophum]
MKRLLQLGLMAVLLSSCSINVLNNMNASVGTTFEVLKQEVYGGWDDESNLIISKQSELDKLYKELNQGDAPKINFETNKVVALFMGQKRTGGYSISVRKITVNGNTTTVSVKRSTPEGNMVTMALTAPYCIAIIPNTEKVVVE